MILFIHAVWYIQHEEEDDEGEGEDDDWADM